MKKRNLLICILLFSILVTACDRIDESSEKSQGFDENTSNNIEETYEIIAETYLVEDDENSISIQYPVISDLSDKDMQKKINEVIMQETLKIYDYYDYEDRGHLDLEIEFNIALESSSILSIQYYGLGYVENVAHPNKLFYTTNIDMQRGVKLKLVDLISIEDDFVNMFINGDFKHVGPLEEDPILDYNYPLAIVKENFINADNMGSEFSYLTNDSLGISIPASHAIGGYALYEIKYDDIKEFCTENNQAWNELLNNK
jgi:hypothetical protein